MTTLAIMKDRIAREVRRSNIAVQIGEAINSAIDCYDADRFWFNESRSCTFVTTAMKEFYTKVDVPGLALLTKIDFTILYVNTTPFELWQSDQVRLEVASQNGTMSGQPGEFGWYDETLRLYPIPADAWTIRIGMVAERAPPASDSEIGNVWMVQAERLIRARAKLELARHVLRDQALAGDMQTATEDAFKDLKIMTTRRIKGRKSRVKTMEF